MTTPAPTPSTNFRVTRPAEASTRGYKYRVTDTEGNEGKGRTSYTRYAYAIVAVNDRTLAIEAQSFHGTFAAARKAWDWRVVQNPSAEIVEITVEGEQA